MRPDFVATHRRLADPGCFVTGNRILLSRELTAKVLREKLMPESWRMGYWLAERRRGGVNRLRSMARGCFCSTQVYACVRVNAYCFCKYSATASGA